MKRIKNTRLQKLSDFYCTCCGHKGIPIFRVAGKEREPGHLKKLYCLYCEQEKNMVEIKASGKYTLEDFNIEYNYGNFTEDGERKFPYKQFIALVRDGHITEKRGGGYIGGIEE